MKLNRRQRETLAVCMFCQKKLDPDEVGEVLESGVRPSQLQCARCEASKEYLDKALIELGLDRATDLVRERARKAGVKNQYEREAFENDMKKRGENN